MLNNYGDSFKPTAKGHGVDIASQRQDELDLTALADVAARVSSGGIVRALDLGGGHGAQSLRFAKAGATVTMIDIADMASTAFNEAVQSGAVPKDRLSFRQRDFGQLAPEDLPAGIDVFYSQRAIHYLPYRAAERCLATIFNRMNAGGSAYLSAAGYDTEYGLTYPGRDKPVMERFDFVTPDMQEKHAIHHKIVTYREEELAQLLQGSGFEGITVTRSSFGNIKAMARRP